VPFWSLSIGPGRETVIDQKTSALILAMLDPVDASDDLLAIERDEVRVRIAGVGIDVRRSHP
jgi:hypothetical protein